MRIDLATIGGVAVATGVIAYLVLYEGDPRGFLNKHAFVTVFGGALAATLIRFPLGEVLSGIANGVRYAFVHAPSPPRDLIEQITEIADVVRKKGPIALETMEINDEFLARGVRMIADGYDGNFIRETLERERDLNATRLEVGVKVYKSIADCAPAMGMVGTLIGMVQMFQNMSDPSKLGPAMAIALLATLYGAVLANFICAPIAEKLELLLAKDEINETLVIDGILQVRENKSPAVIREMLLTYLPHHHREDAEEQAAA
jgi:chemotaxis protein MotA